MSVAIRLRGAWGTDLERDDGVSERQQVTHVHAPTRGPIQVTVTTPRGEETIDADSVELDVLGGSGVRFIMTAARGR